MDGIKEKTEELLKNSGYSGERLEEVVNFRERLRGWLSSEGYFPTWEDTIKLYEKFDGDERAVWDHYTNINSLRMQVRLNHEADFKMSGKQIISLILDKSMDELNAGRYSQDFEDLNDERERAEIEQVRIESDVYEANPFAFF